MKKLIIAAALILLVGTTIGQTLQKGSIIGVHHMTISLNPDVTMNQFLDVFKNEWIPEAEKQLDGWKAFIVKGNKGEHKNEYGLVWYIESVEDRDKYYDDEGNLNEAGKVGIEKMREVDEKLEKLGTWSSKYTDWVIQ